MDSAWKQRQSWWLGAPIWGRNNIHLRWRCDFLPRNEDMTISHGAKSAKSQNLGAVTLSYPELPRRGFFSLIICGKLCGTRQIVWTCLELELVGGFYRDTLQSSKQQLSETTGQSNHQTDSPLQPAESRPCSYFIQVGSKFWNFRGKQPVHES